MLCNMTVALKTSYYIKFLTFFNSMGFSITIIDGFVHIKPFELFNRIEVILLNKGV